MDGSIEKKRNVNPREEANVFSKITFLFAYTTFQLGLRKDIEENDVYQIVKNCKSSNLGNLLEAEWEKEKVKPNPTIIKPLIRIFGAKYALYSLALLIVNTSLMIAKPLLIGKIVHYFSLNQTDMTQQDALFYSLGLIGCFLLDTVFSHSYNFAVEQLILRIKAAISSFIYRKSLKLSSEFVNQSSNGQAVTLITKDIITVDYCLIFGNLLIIGIFQLMVLTYVMYTQIQGAALVGSGVLLLFIPLQGVFGKLASKFKVKTVSKTDVRINLTQELLSAMRIIKMYTWELFFYNNINEARKKEIKNLRILFYIKMVGVSLGNMSSKIALYACVIVYISLDNHITAEKAFVVKGCFEVLQFVMMLSIPIGITLTAEFEACMRRITNFLLIEEAQPNLTTFEEKPKINIQGVNVKSAEHVDVLEDVNVDVKPGLTILSGSVGAGKSTLLKLILGDVNISSGLAEVAGKKSYASQEPWLFPGTIRQNIVFSELFDEERYEAVVKACALQLDLATFPRRDLTCVTDRGLNLSRGQKTRISLARAVYRNADIYLLDDCLSAVDTHVAKHIFQECIKNFLKDKICILITHQIWCLPKADNLIVLSNGCVKYQGTYSNFKDLYGIELESESGAIQGVNEADLILQKVESEELDDGVDESSKLISDNLDASRNIYGETKEEGTVKKEVYLTYFMSGGGIKMLLLLFGVILAAQLVSGWSEYFVTTWVDTEQQLSGFRLNNSQNTTEFETLENSRDDMIKLYSFVIVAACVLAICRSIAFFTFCSRVSTNLHQQIIDNIINAGMIFFDNNLAGNILNRFSRDLGLIDDIMPFVLFELTIAVMVLITVLIIVSTVNPYFLIPSLLFGIILVYARHLYLPTGRSLRRLQGTTRSALVGYLNSTMEGLTTIRASGAQGILRKEFDKHQDLYNSVSYMCISTTRAFAFYTDMLSMFYITIITLTFIFVKTDVLAGKVGLALTQALALTGILQWVVREWAELENQMTAVERVIEYTKIESEEKSGMKPSNWPNQGKIIYDDVNLRYTSNSERVLKDVNFEILPQQKIGIVGRTGAGKSSIISTLFRLYEFRGLITIDGIDINCIGVEWLRSKMSVIPQDPVLFYGTIRSNLDPNKEYTDKVLWDALNEVEMKNLISSLHTPVKAGGNNFSIGQRQLICLARAIVRNNRILVLDEATANVDPNTDLLIQKTIKKLFYDCTVITIAHRLYTIMDSDRVIVMDAGSIVECDSPKILLKNKNGLFYKMVKEAGLL